LDSYKLKLENNEYKSIPTTIKKDTALVSLFRRFRERVTLKSAKPAPTAI
jgi:hypothetical protein